MQITIIRTFVFCETLYLCKSISSRIEVYFSSVLLYLQFRIAPLKRFLVNDLIFSRQRSLRIRLPMADDYTRSFPLRSHSRLASLQSAYDVRSDGKTPTSNVLPPKDSHEAPFKSNSDNPSTLPHDDSPREALPKDLPGIPTVMKPSLETAKRTITASEISSFNLPSPLSTPHLSESETHNRVDLPKSLASSALFGPGEKSIENIAG